MAEILNIPIKANADKLYASEFNELKDKFNALANEVNSVINVLYHGVKGDGLTEDTAAIHDIISKLPANGGVLFFPNGTYLANLVLTKPVTIIGGGKSTIFKSNNLTPVITIDGVNNSISQITIRDLVIDGNNKTSKGLYLNAYTSRVIKKSIFQNLFIQDVTTGIDINCSSANEVYLNYFNNISITRVKEYGIYGRGGYNSFINISVTESDFYAVCSTGSGCNYQNIVVDGVIKNTGVNNIFENVHIETIFSQTPASDKAFQSTGDNTVVNHINIINCVILYGVSLSNRNSIIGLRLYGASTDINYPIHIEAASSGIMFNIYTSGFGYALSQYTTEARISAWNILQHDNV